VSTVAGPSKPGAQKQPCRSHLNDEPSAVGDRGTVGLMAVFLLAQPLTAFAVATPLGTITADNIVLLCLAARLLPRYNPKDGESRTVGVCIAVWAFTFLWRISYQSMPASIREMITAVSFLLIVLVSESLPLSRKTIRALGVASYVALCIFGLTAYAVATGRLSAPNRVAEPRDIFGVTSPWVRNYGLNVAIDAIALLMPVCLAPLALALVGKRRGGVVRVSAMLAFIPLAFFSLYLFQARGMLIQIVLSVTIALCLTRPLTRVVILPAAIYAAVVSAQSFISVDSISSETRLANYGASGFSVGNLARI
jgi:hypothetical protein